MVCVVPLLLRTALTVATGKNLLKRWRFAGNQVLILLHLAYHCARIKLQEGKSDLDDPLLLVVLAYMYFVATFPHSDNEGGENTSLIMFLCCVLSLFYTWRFYSLFMTLRNFSKHLVSKKKRRFIDSRGGFDLDLSFITAQVIAMGFPTESLLEQQIRNPMDQVRKFFRSRYPGHHKVYNLCSERTYSQKSFDNEYHDVRFPDHNPCRLAALCTICEDMEQFLREDRVRNVIAVHCKAGKGRTGLVVSSFLLHAGKCSRASDALETFAQKRTHDGKGVTIPSQIRYVHHYEEVVREGKVRDPLWLRLTRVEVSPQPTETWDFQLRTHEAGVIFDTTRDSVPPLLEGDVKAVFFQGKQKLFHLWLHTAYDPQKLNAGLAADAAEDAFTAMWSSEKTSDVVHDEGCYSVSLKRQQLDGPHKKKKKGKKEDKSAGLAEVRLFFTKASAEEVQAAHAELERQQVHRKREEEALKRKHEAEAQERAERKTFFKPKSFFVPSDAMEDYDDLEYDTDHDEILGTLCRGYLVRDKGSCSRPQERLCELFTSGRLHISGGDGLFWATETLIVDLTEDAENVLQDADHPEDPPSAWRLRNPHSKCWELLQATDPSEAIRWAQGLADAVRLGRAAKDPLTSFAGFFWKLNSNRDALPIPGSFEYEHWRIRLFVLRADGNMLVYSHKTRSEEIFCNFCTPGCELVTLPITWRGMEHMVLFQLATDGADKPRRTLAAPHEDFEAFAMRVAAFRRFGTVPWH